MLVSSPPALPTAGIRPLDRGCGRGPAIDAVAALAEGPRGGGGIAGQVAGAGLGGQGDGIAGAEDQLLGQLKGDAEARSEVVVHRIPGEAVIGVGELETAFERQPGLLGQRVGPPK